MKPVLLLAYTNVNFGDDMFIKTICTMYPEIKFELEAPSNYNEIMSSVNNLKIVTHTKTYKMFEKIDSLLLRVLPLKVGFFRHIWLKKYIALVYVIGGLFDEDDLWQQQVKRLGKRRYKNAILKKSFCKNPPFFLMGCNVTRVKSDSYIDLMRYVFKDLRDICFRDKYSLMHFPLENARYAPDLVFNYPVQHYIRKKKIVISVWGCLTKCEEMPQWKWAENNWGGYKDLIINIIDYFDSIGYQIELLSLCENEGDFQACELLKQEAKTDKLSVISYEGNLEKIMKCIAEADFVIGTRFHSVVLALSSKTPVYPIAYESKTLQLLKDCKFEGEYSEISEIKKDEINKVKNSFANYRFCNEIDLIKSKAREQFSEFNKIL